MNKLTANQIAQIIILENIKIGDVVFAIVPYSQFEIREHKFISIIEVTYDNLVDIALLWNLKYYPSLDAAQAALYTLKPIMKISDDTIRKTEFKYWEAERQGKILDKLI